MTADTVTTDGRRRRRERNVVAVLEAVHGLLLEGYTSPPPELVASRSGVSLRSLYRYFPDREQLVMAALSQQLGFAELLFYIEDTGTGPRAERIDRFVAHRLAVHDVMAPTARVALVAARELPALAQAVSDRRAQMRGLVAEHFAPDLTGLAVSRREECEEAIDVLCQFESIETLRVTRGLDPVRTHGVLVRGVGALVAAAT